MERPTDTATPDTATGATATVRKHFWAIVFWATAIATGLPFLFVVHPPFTDMPEHVAAMATLGQLLPGGGGAPYEVAFGTSQYLVYHALGAVLGRALGDVVLANRLLLVGVAVLWPLSLRSLLRAFGRDERLAIFGAMLFWNRALVIGFLPFVASVPVGVFTLALLVRQLETPSRKRALGLGALSLLLFYTHVSAFVLTLLTASVMIAIRLIRSPRRGSLLVMAAAPLAPSALAAAVWWRAGSLADAGGQLEHVKRLPAAVLLDAMPIWTFELWASHVDELAAGIWWSAFLVVAALGLREKGRVASLFALVPFACAALVYFFTPFYVGAAGYLNVRLAPLLALFAILALRPRVGRGGDGPLLAAAIAALIMAGDATFEMRRMEREELGGAEFETLLAHARPGSRLAMLNFETRSPRAHFWPYPFAGSYHRARNGGVAGYSFTELPHWPVHYARGEEPPKRAPFWVYAPCAYRYRGDGAYYDYVLLQGTFDAFSDAPGPTFVPIAHAGHFTLFEKTGPEPAHDAETGPTDATSAPNARDTKDQGPCRHRPPAAPAP